MMQRREVLRMFGAVAAGAVLPRRRTALNTVGVQLYLLRDEFRRNPEATISRIATLGYADVEWWGKWERSPAQLRGLLDAAGLTSSAVHVDPADLVSDRLPALLEAAQTMGQDTILVSWISPAEHTRDGWLRFARLLNDAGGTAARVGIKTGYHNQEFGPNTPSGPRGWEVLFAETDPSLVAFELDFFWAIKAGVDPLELLDRNPGRFKRVHLKDSSGPPQHRQLDVGAGVIDWRTLLSRAADHGVTHLYVEHDEPTDPWATAANGRAYLRSIGY